MPLCRQSTNMTTFPKMSISNCLVLPNIVAIFALAVLAEASAQPNADGQESKAVTAIAAQQLAVDGDLSEPAWQGGPWYEGFTVAGGTDLASPDTRFAVRFDDSHLYVVVVALEPNVAAIRRAATSRDSSSIFHDDCVEFMIDPTGDRVRYYHFAVSAGGAFYDAERRQGGHVASKEWDSSASAAARIGQQGFTVEVAIPLVELGLAGHSATQPWAIQVARERHAGGKLELSSYIPCGGTFHVPATYAPLTLKGVKLARFLWDIGDPLEQLVTREDGELMLHFQVLIRNLTDRFHFTQVTASLPNAAGTSHAVRTGGHDVGQQQTYGFALRVANAGGQNLCLTVADRETPDVPLGVRSIPVSLNYSPVRLLLTSPGYRNTVYATQNLSEIKVEVELSLPADQVQGAAISGSLLPAGQVAPMLATGSATATGRTSRLTIPLPDLEVGSYDLRVTVSTADGIAYPAQARIHKVAPVAHEWRLDENLVAVHNGEPFLPYGWFGADVLMPDPYPLFSEGGFAGRPIEYTSTFMQACREASRGQKAWWITPQAFDYYMNKPNSRPPTFTELRNQQLQAFINGARGILWYTYGHRHNYESLDLGIPFLGREARALRAAILAPERPGAITWTADAPGHIQAAVRTVGKHATIFTVNTATAPQNAQFTVKGLSVNTLYVVAEDRTVEVAGGRFSDTFELYGGHIYTTDTTLAEGTTLAQTQAAIEKAKTLRQRPGNLAYRELDTHVTYSSISPYSGRPSMVIDGKRKGKEWRDNTWKRWPDWIQVNFPEPVTVGRVLVFSGSVRDYEIQAAADDGFVTIAKGTRSDGEPIQAQVKPVVTSSVRVVVLSSSDTGSSVTEIEVYEK